MVHGPGWSIRLSIDLGPWFVSVCFHVHVYNEKQAQLGVVHGPGPQRWSMDRVHGVVHGPGPQEWSMDPGPCFVYVLLNLKNHCVGEFVVYATLKCFS